MPTSTAAVVLFWVAVESPYFHENKTFSHPIPFAIHFGPAVIRLPKDSLVFFKEVQLKPLPMSSLAIVLEAKVESFCVRVH